MKPGWTALRQLRELFAGTAPEPEEMAVRLKMVERDIILPVKAVAVGILLYSLYRSRWFEDIALTSSVAHEVFERFFLIYLVINVAMACLLILSPGLPSVLVQRLIFGSNFLDGLFLSAVCFVTGGFDSSVYWLFLGLIIRNALSLPLAGTQLLLNFSLSFCYLAAGILDVSIHQDLFDEPSRSEASPAEPFLLRLFVLWLLTLCVYGLQVLLEKHRQAREEAREFNARQKELHSAGRLAAQIAHQLKNPLGIINNAAFTLNRSLRESKDGHLQQVNIIREEVERADRIITKLMGYSQLAEGKVEKLNVAEEIDRAIREVFPAGAKYDTVVVTEYPDYLPKLLMQSGHLSEILINLLANAREALNGGGEIRIVVRHGQGNSVSIEISDNGPGIPTEHMEKVFDAYFSTKEKGTGLGLAIVKHNTELYGGSVQIESVLGKGTRFILNFPTRTFMKLRT